MIQTIIKKLGENDYRITIDCDTLALIFIEASIEHTALTLNAKKFPDLKEIAKEVAPNFCKESDKYTSITRDEMLKSKKAK